MNWPLVLIILLLLQVPLAMLIRRRLRRLQ